MAVNIINKPKSDKRSRTIDKHYLGKDNILYVTDPDNDHIMKMFMHSHLREGVMQSSRGHEGHVKVGYR